VHIGDRESDIYELFSECEALKTNFIFRTCVDRQSGDRQETVMEVMEEQRVKAVHRIEVRDNKGRPSTAVLEIKYHRLVVCPPLGKEKRYEPLTLTVIHATERSTPKDRDRIEWKLVTNLPVTCKADAIRMLEWYAMRWKIETFHKVLKSGCKAEDSKLRTAERSRAAIRGAGAAGQRPARRRRERSLRRGVLRGGEGDRQHPGEGEFPVYQACGPGLRPDG
jgi:hypothetical protein